MTTRSSIVVVAGLLLLIAIACKTNQTSSLPASNNNHPASQSTPDQFAAIRPIYEKECKSCHGETGLGGPVKLDDGSKLKVPSLREARAVRHEDGRGIGITPLRHRDLNAGRAHRAAAVRPSRPRKLDVDQRRAFYAADQGHAGAQCELAAVFGIGRATAYRYLAGGRPGTVM